MLPSCLLPPAALHAHASLPPLPCLLPLPQQPRLARFLEKEVAAPGSAAAAAAEPDGWVEMPDVDAESTFASKPIKALILKTGRCEGIESLGRHPRARAVRSASGGRPPARRQDWPRPLHPHSSSLFPPSLFSSPPPRRAVCLYKPPGEGTIYASDASSTAYKYPLADAAILNVKGKAAVEVPLDGACFPLLFAAPPLLPPGSRDAQPQMRCMQTVCLWGRAPLCIPSNIASSSCWFRHRL